MIQKLKSLLFRLYLARCRCKLRRRGVEVAGDAVINAMPDVRMAKGSRIILHEGATLTSNARHIPLLRQPMQLRTLTPDAVIELMPHSGISGSLLVCANRITIGEYTIIGADTLIYDSFGHTYNNDTGWNSFRALTGSPITIGKKCFIGTRCTIMGGVTIGDNCLVSACTVVTSDIPPGHKAYGNPMKIEPLPGVLGGVKNAALRRTEGKPEPQAFLGQMQQLLELPFAPQMQDEFRSYEEWDSLALLTLSTAMKEDYGVNLSTELFNAARTWGDLYRRLP